MDDKILFRLQRQCVSREYCEKDIRAKALKAADGDSDAADRLVASLLKDGFVDNLRYATAFAREKSAISGWGPVKISYALTAKGISREDISRALEETDPGESAKKMEGVLAAKWRTLEGDPQGRLKLLRFGLSRGYTYDDIKDTVEKLTH